MTVQEAQNKITSSEFIEWLGFLEKDIEIPTRQDYYLAQIAAEQRRSLVKHPERVKMSDFILRFEDNTILDDSKEARTKRMKNFFGRMLGPDTFRKKEK